MEFQWNSSGISKDFHWIPMGFLQESFRISIIFLSSSDDISLSLLSDFRRIPLGIDKDFYSLFMVEGSLEAKLPTIWKDGKGTARKKLGRGESQK